MAAPYLFVGLGLMLFAFIFYSGPFWWMLPLPAIVVLSALWLIIRAGSGISGTP